VSGERRYDRAERRVCNDHVDRLQPVTQPDVDGVDVVGERKVAELPREMRVTFRRGCFIGRWFAGSRVQARRVQVTEFALAGPRQARLTLAIGRDVRPGTRFAHSRPHDDVGLSALHGFPRAQHAFSLEPGSLCDLL
jgi:hypothetical protein